MISIILPTFNSIDFLEERLQTIVHQTYPDWECIVIDGHSKDGTWEMLKAAAEKDERFRLFQFPPNGPYDAWNKGIAKASGDYIYIATADDTMELTLLEIMSKEMDQHTNCGLAHCMLTIIDETGKPANDVSWDNYYSVQYYGDLIRKKHIRLAPLDGILHCGLKTIYSSVTQLLIRKKVFDLAGYFQTDKGSIADFEWGLRVSLLFNTLHIPEYLATWRKHSRQLTNDSIQTNAATYIALQNFIEQAFKLAFKQGLSKKFYHNDLKEYYLKEQLRLELSARKEKSFLSRLSYLLFHFPVMATKKFFGNRLFSMSAISWVTKKVEALDLKKNILTCQ
jgi:glycosyltransferase involved in cell wall biosynthesis